MNPEKYQVIFAGQISENADLEQVKLKLANLFKTDRSQIDTLFSGKRLVIKDNLDYEIAVKYQAAIKQQGAECELKMILPTQYSSTRQEQPTTNPQSASSINQPANETITSQPDSTGQQGEVQPCWHKGIATFKIGSLSETSIAPPGTELVKPVIVAAAQIETDHLSMAECGATLGETRVQEAPGIAIDHIQLIKD